MKPSESSQTPRQELYLLADRIRAIADAGLTFSKDEYDLERYRELQGISGTLAGTVDRLGDQPDTQIHDPRPHHLSPLCGVDAVVMRNDRMLLLKRPDTGRWAMPGGLLEVGETPAEGCVRELEEETRVVGRATRLLGVFDSRLWGYRLQFQLLSFVFAVEHVASEPVPTDEALEVDYFAADELPPLSFGHEERVPLAFRLLREVGGGPHFDPA